MSQGRPAAEQRCSTCGHSIGLLEALTKCPRCGGLFDIVHSGLRNQGDFLRQQFAERWRASVSARAPQLRSGVWRYRELVMPADDMEIVSYPEGNTPLLSRSRISAWAGSGDLCIKHEGLNPTGSFKDRGMSVAVTQARRLGASAVACASTGNTASSLAAYAGIANIPALVLVPAGHVAQGKLSQTIAYGARTLLVRGDFDDCMRLVREASDKLGVYLVNSVNPFRVEGQKTIVLELLQQLDWLPPDWIALPAGNLGNASAFGKALADAHAAGLITRIPRLLLVQAAGASPFALSFRDGFSKRHVVQAETIASAIRIGDPASYDRAVRAVRYTNAEVIDVGDDEIMEAKAVIDASGVGCEPASAASVAGVRRMVQNGAIGPDERVVAILTGHVLKDAAPSPAGARSLPEIEPTVAAVEAELKRA